MNEWKVLTFLIYCEEVNYPSRIHSGLQSQFQDSQSSKKNLVSKSKKKKKNSSKLSRILPN